MKTTTLLLSALAALFALSGCAVPRYLIGDSFTGGRGDKIILVPAVKAEKNQVLYDYVVRLCDVDAQGAETQCKDSVVLGNVVSNSVY